MAPKFAVTRSPDLDYLWKFLTTNQIAQASGGRMRPLTAEQAAGLIGNWIVETGRPNLSGLDVIEAGARAGRGLSQYTGPRREAYERARAAALRQGQDPNSAAWQAMHFVQEYLGQHDRGGSLVGYTRTFERMPPRATPEGYAAYFTDSYFRPGIPHYESRKAAASQVYRIFGTPPVQPKPKPQPTRAPNPMTGYSLQIPGF